MPVTPAEAPTLRIGARVLLLDPDDHVLLIHARDPDQPDHHWWELPGGGADPDEPLADTARRELAEETDRPPGEAAVRIVLAEDLLLLRDGLVRMLSDSGHTVVAAVSTAPELEDAVAEHEPDLSIVDVRLPPGFRDEGLRAALAIRHRKPGTPILTQRREERPP